MTCQETDSEGSTTAEPSSTCKSGGSELRPDIHTKDIAELKKNDEYWANEVLDAFNKGKAQGCIIGKKETLAKVFAEVKTFEEQAFETIKAKNGTCYAMLKSQWKKFKKELTALSEGAEAC